MNGGSDVQHIAATLTSGLLVENREGSAQFAVGLYREVLKALREKPEDETGMKEVTSTERRIVDPA